VATLKDGLTTYFKTFSGTVNRWGDYSAAQVDPVNDVDLWTIQEYAASPANRWGTWWGVLAPPPDLTIDDVSLAEGNSGTTNARFTISLSFPSSQLVEVDWVAKDGTATLADSDFQAASGRASFPPGTTTVSVDVPVVGDLKLEPNETFTVDLSNPLFGVIADAQGQGTILDDDTSRRLHTVAPCRLVDTRSTQSPLVGGSSRYVTVAGSCGVPVQALAVAVNVTAVNPGDVGDLRVFPPGPLAPLASTLNFATAKTRSNLAVVTLYGSALEVQCDMASGPAASTHLVLDVFGYFR
jgi:hypothetical protein